MKKEASLTNLKNPSLLFLDVIKELEKPKYLLMKEMRMKSNLMVGLLDSLKSNLSRRKKGTKYCRTEVEVLSLVVSPSKESSNETIAKEGRNKMYLELEGMKIIPEVYKYIRSNELSITFPILEVALRIYLAVSNYPVERSLF